MIIVKEKAIRIVIELTYKEMDLLLAGKTVECRAQEKDEKEVTIIEIYSADHYEEGEE